MELKIEEIRELIQLIDQSSIDEFEYEQDGDKIVLSKHKGTNGQPVAVPTYQEQPFFTEPAQAPQKSAEMQGQGTRPPEKASSSEGQQDDNVHKIKSPMVGTFYASPSPEEGAYVKTGDKVNSDTVVCIVEAMKLFNEIEAEETGEIVQVLAEDGELVEYGQPLFSLRKEK